MRILNPILIVFVLLISACEEVAAPEGETTDKVKESIKETAEETQDNSVVFAGQLVDTVTNSFGDLEIIQREFEIIADEKTGALDTVFQDTEVFQEEEWQIEEEAKQTALDSLSRLTETFTILNSYSIPVYVEVWSGYSLEYDEGIVLGKDLNRVQQLIEIPAGEERALFFEEDMPHLIIVGLIRKDFYRFLTSLSTSGIESSGLIELNTSGLLIKK